jgi:hypothetical protein
MPIDNIPPYEVSNVSKFPIPGAHNKLGLVYVAKNCEPKDFLFQVMRDQNQHCDRRMEAAKALLPYCHAMNGGSVKVPKS